MILVAYLLLSIFIITFDMGDKNFPTIYVNYITQWVPSILPTAKITADYQSSKLILAVAWTIVPINIGIFLMKMNWESPRFLKFYSQLTFFKKAGIVFFFPIMLIFKAFVSPSDDSGRISKMIYSLLANTEGYVIVHGLFIWVLLSFGLSASIIVLIYSLKRITKWLRA